MKKAVFIVLQALWLLAAYYVGAVLQMFHKLPTWSMATNGGRSQFYWDGLVCLLVGFLLIVVVQAARKVLATRWVNPIVALVLALLILAATRFPLSTYTPSTM